MSDAVCACLCVGFDPVTYPDGSRTERWLCRDCGREFLPRRQCEPVVGEMRREQVDTLYMNADPVYPPELEWSIESAGSEPKQPIRLCVGTSDGFVELKDVMTTSHGPRFQPVPDKSNHRVGMTLYEAEWLLARLPEVLARAREHRRLDELHTQKL